MNETETPTKLTKELKLQHWGEGPWVDEKDLEKFEHCGLECLVRRQCAWDGHNGEYLGMGHFCGYVRIPRELIKVDVEEFCNLLSDIEVHGGITFNSCDENRVMVGFDCAHAWDVVPSVEAIKNEYNLWRKLEYKFFPDTTYKDFEFAKGECKSMAEQALKLLIDAKAAYRKQRREKK